MQIDGCSVLVTGAGSGLGEATARMLAARGAKVAILDRDLAKAQMVAGEIGGVAVGGDVTAEGDVNAALDAATSAHGIPRIVVNCAGIGTAGRVLGREGPLALEAFQRTINVNLVGTFNVMRLAVARMAQAEPLDDGERGVVINTASVAAFDGQIGQAAYAASKGGIVAMSLPVARELARVGVRVNVVAPGIFLTPLLYTLPEEAQKALAADIPFPQRLGDPAEFADTVCFMATNRYINGECVRLDGSARLKAK
ncbi:SDR family NAD(P)-dependent oxidoreductase [Pararhodobacter zhoushanensis]|uniref:SDR family oxidoreductase n=1 Tax=Pararhodobacter zhoushanensis TaxID=2479545 RepID=A0ABT3GZ58_9RHOB|nr:SDR family NAD(P)-dependent oxidoreductase [Pararhodobacter zhoushanensis]MCW1932846.1 SDR family oxidoreductase [Pararhodobacter zhoushanensis]